MFIFIHILATHSELVQVAAGSFLSVRPVSYLYSLIAVIFSLLGQRQYLAPVHPVFVRLGPLQSSLLRATRVLLILGLLGHLVHHDLDHYTIR